MQCETRLKIRATLITTAAVILGVVTVVGAQHLQVYGNSTTNQDSIVWGNVGIGKDNPNAALDILSSPWNGIKVTGSGGPADVRLWDSDAGASMSMRFYGTATTAGLQFNRHEQAFGAHQATVVSFDMTSAANSLVLNGGKVGIGTTAPAAPLHISNSSGTNVKLGDGNRTLAGGNSAGNIHIDSNSHIYLNHYVTGNVFAATGGGRVGINTQSPGAKLHVYDSGDDIIRIQAGGTWAGMFLDSNVSTKTAAIIFGSNNLLNLSRYGNGFGSWEDNPVAFDLDAPGGTLRVSGDGKVGIGTISPSSKLHVNGGCITGSFCSDARLKRNIRALSTGSVLDKVARLQAKEFEWKDRAEKGTRVGMIAQDVEAVFPELVTTGEGGMEKGLDCTGLNAITIEAIKELNDKVERLESELATCR